MNTKSVFLKIYFFLLVFILAVYIGRGFITLWLNQNGFTFPQISLFYLIDFAIPPLILLFVVKKFSTVKSFSIAFISEILLMVSLYRFFHPWQIYLSGLLAGTTVVFFYITYNTLYFENTPKNKRATSASLFTLVGPFMAILVPLVVGFFGQKWGLSAIFLVAAFILLINFYLIRFLPKIEFESNLRKSLTAGRQINFLLFLEGVRETAMVAISLFVLFFIRQPLPFGIFFSYLGFTSAATTVLLGFVSDKLKKRTFVLYPITSMVALSIIGLGFSQTLIWLTIFSGILGFISTINGTFVTTMVLDKVPKIKEGMIGREFLLGAGRVVGMLIIFTSFILFNSPKVALILIGSLYFLFPITLYFKKIY